MSSDDDAQLRDSLGLLIADRREPLVELWERLGERGPTFGQVIEADPAAVRRGFLMPLARMLGEAVTGSAFHRAAYLEARVAYLPKALPGPERAAIFTERLTSEAATIGAMVGGESGGALAAVLDELHAPLMHAPLPGDPRVLFVGDCLFSEVRCFLSERFASRTGRTLDADHIYFANGIEPLDPDAVRRSIENAAPTVVGLSLFSFNAMPAYGALLEQASGARPVRFDAPVGSLVAMLRNSILAIREVTDATILIHTPSALPLRSRVMRFGWYPTQTRNRQRLIRSLSRGVAELVAGTENTLLVDEPRLIDAAGGLRTVGQPLMGAEYEGAYAHHSQFGSVLADEYADVLRSHDFVGRAKALLVDFDNTLWAGVMGDGPVVHHRERQRVLRQLREAGVLLVALSKNDPSTIRWDELELEPEDFVIQHVNWKPKPENVSNAIAALDLAADAFVLLDDNPVERALVTENVAGVKAMDPDDPFTWRTLERWLEFPSTKQTEEARRRTTMYREAAERRAALGGDEHNYEQMMRSLELRAELRPATPEDKPRLLELIQRTNQFNTTTRRRTAAEVDTLVAASEPSVFVASLRDRFGDLGVVAVIIATRSDGDSVEIDSFIMSCRAMGFGLETFALARLITEVPAPRYTASFIATERNGPAASLYPSSGFAEVEPGRWLLEDPTHLPHAPAWFTADGS